MEAVRSLLRVIATLAPLALSLHGSTAVAQTGAAQSPAAPALDAEPVEPDVSDAAKDRARSLYEKGVKAYAEGRYYEAADYFIDTDRIYPTAQLSFNVGKAYDKVGNVPGALRYYRDYLRRQPDAADRADVTVRVRALEQLLSERGLQQLSVLSSPEGATVLLDGRPVGITPWTGETWPGRHRVNLLLPGYRTSDDVVELDVHRGAEAEVVLVREPPARKVEPMPARPLAARASVSPLTWVALGLGTLAFGTALTLEMADGDREGISRPAAFFGGMGIAGSALGGVMLYMDMSGAGATANTSLRR